MSNTRLDELKRYVDSLSTADYAKHADKTKDNPQAIFDLIGKGDTVGVYVGLKEGVKPDIKDKNGQTPLHRAAGKNTRLISDVLLDTPNKTLWVRDKQNRLPLDVAREAGHKDMGNKLERFTYPQLFRHEKGSNIKAGLLDKYNTERKKAKNPDTRPSYAPDFAPKAPFKTLVKEQSKEKVIDR